MDRAFERTFDPAAVEARIAKLWQDADAFAAQRPERRGAEPFSIVIPPPNVTGSLHMGHALNATLQDILCRFERMRGKDVLWQPGTDHAGIATQMVVERQLAAQGKPDRRALGRAAFLEEVWAWKEESGNTILSQLQRLGASCDFARTRFTMDAGLSQAVTKVFVKLHRDGLIYKDKRLVNWDPKLLTAISDLEVEQREIKGFMWYFNYPIEGAAYDRDNPDSFVTIATTRPETMLGDGAVAVHPDNPRLKHLIGRVAILPLVNRRLPIIADTYADPEKGTGAVKITSAHDFNDFEVGKRHNLPLYTIMTPDARLNDSVPEAYRGLDRYVARKLVVEDIEALGFLNKIEPHTHMVPHGDRSGVVIEPLLTDQWYVNAAALAKPALAAVRAGHTRFVPKAWEKTYYDWLENIEPWCISRQLWWGHQIPAWYRGDGTVIVAHDAKEAQEIAGAGVALTRDADVLDTWFSSSLWPFSTLGWPLGEDPALARFYPTSILITGFDIIFFWVARMMMMGLYVMEAVPFHEVYIHALVRDEKGAKMSKSKGNVIDPLELIDTYGADALRFTLAAMAAQGRDIKLATARVEGYRNFATKLWNAARFGEMNGCFASEAEGEATGDGAAGPVQPVNAWMLAAFDKAVHEVTQALEARRFNEAALSCYRLIWNVFCDWYVELAKPLLGGQDEAARDETRHMFARVFDGALKLLHPFMPFLTEELWALTGARARSGAPLLTLAFWPKSPRASGSGAALVRAADEIAFLIDLISAIRSVRNVLNVPAGSQLPLLVVQHEHAGAQESAETMAFCQRHAATLGRLARVRALECCARVPEEAAPIKLGQHVFALPLKGVIDFATERARLIKDVAKQEREADKIAAKLANEAFIAKAPEEVVEEQRTRLEEAQERIAFLREALLHLG